MFGFDVLGGVCSGVVLFWGNFRNFVDDGSVAWSVGVQGGQDS